MLYVGGSPREFVKIVKSGYKHYPVDSLSLPLNEYVKPYDHQKRGFLIAKTLDNCGLFFDPGLGKTLVTIATITHRAWHKEINRVLILAPLSVVPVWYEQFHEHGSPSFVNHDIDLYILDGRKVNDRVALINEITRDRIPELGTASGKKVEIIVTNYDSLGKMEEAITKWKPDMIVADESQAFKNRKAERTKVMWRLGKLPKYKMVLTGTPVTESPLDYWAQYKFLDQNVFGKKFVSFRDRFATMGGYGGFQVKKYRNLKTLAREAYSIGYRVAKEDALDLPPTIDITRYCYLEPSSARIYKEMEKERLIKFLGGPDADAPIVLTALMRMQQITGGFLKREDGSYAETGGEKLNLLEEVLEEIPKEEKIVIFARFTPEIQAIKEVVADAGRTVDEISGKVKAQARKELRHRFQKTSDPNVLVVQIGAGGVGIDLYAASTAIFYSHDPSFGKLKQAEGRLDRIGQQGERVNFIHLLAKDTIDETIYQALKEKRSLFELVMNKYLKQEEREVAKKKKSKVETKRVAPSEMEEKDMVERLKKLKNEVEEEGGVEEMPKTKKSKATTKVETIHTEDAGLITVKDLADELGITPVALRKALRGMDVEKPSGRWEWPEDHEDLETIRDHFSGESEEEEEPKPKKAKKTKKVKPEPEPEPEEEEEEEEIEDEEDEEYDDEDILDYEEMSKPELKELCEERDIKVTKKMSKENMIELLMEWDNEEFEDEDDE